jgi:uncharacterized protein YigA (DUF484 family)
MSEDSTSLEEVVADYLHQNPRFLLDHPEILETLELSHNSGVASSLIERQVEALRASNEEMNLQLKRLVKVAADNEQLMARLHHLTIALMQLESNTEFFTELGSALLNDFDADILQFCLFDETIARDAGDDVVFVSREDESLEPFLTHLDKNQSVCGRLSESKMVFLFGSKARWIQSTALVPLGEGGVFGMMAIGSSDPSRFFPGMGTLFLDLLAQVISARLTRVEPGEQRRTA